MGKAAAAYNRCGFGFYYAGSGSTSNAFYANVDSAPGGFKLYGTGQFLVEATIAATSTSTGSITTPGGISCGGAFYVGGGLTLSTSGSASSNYLTAYQASLATGNYTQQLFGVSSTYAGVLSFKYVAATASQNYIYFGVNNGTFVNVNYDGSITVNCTADATDATGTTGAIQVLLKINLGSWGNFCSEIHICRHNAKHKFLNRITIQHHTNFQWWS